MPSATIVPEYEERTGSISFTNCFVFLVLLAQHLLEQNTLPPYTTEPQPHTQKSMYVLGKDKLTSGSQQAVFKIQ